MPSFLDQARWNGKGLIDGWQSLSGGTHDIRNPATDDVIATVAMATPTDVGAAAGRASAAQAEWAALPAAQRGKILSKAADLLEEHGEELIAWIMRESGSIQPKAAVEIEHSAGFIRHAAAMATEPNGHTIPSDDGRFSIARRVPHGVVGVISPFNFPLILSIRAVAPALAVGNAVVLKPDPRTPISGGVTIARIFEEAGLPAGVLSVISGGADAGEAMCTDPNIAMVSFTGSAEIGAKVGELCGRHIKKVQLELGGKNALVVLDDADLDTAVSNAAWGCYLHQGQICMATGLVLVQEAIAQTFVEKLAAKARQLPAGDPMSGQVALGPIINDRQVDRIQRIVDESVAQGARLVTGGRHDGRFYAATVLADVRPGMPAFDEEIFGPVAVVAAFATDEDAVDLANRSDYGLAAGVISSSLNRALAVGNRLNVGHLHINDQTVMAGPFAPFGGCGKSGNGGRISGPANWEEFTQWQWVTVKDSAGLYPF
ncbi:benzaldehyde dehydrogenase [Amorphus sp. 3PC139-8]|uniref:benzaldehyde dehydrogenase n=1 Tax=Amorphus sp. 3PC139-8 TaxID=2735676 RepID=UPI00345D9767